MQKRCVSIGRLYANSHVLIVLTKIPSYSAVLMTNGGNLFVRLLEGVSNIPLVHYYVALG